MNLVDMIKGYGKYENRLQKIRSGLEQIYEQHDYDETILRLKVLKSSYSFRRAEKDRKLDSKSLLSELQHERNKHYANDYRDHDEIRNIADAVDGRGCRYWKDRLTKVNNYLSKKREYSLNDIDDMRYILASLKTNKYLGKKAENDRNIRKLKKMAEKNIAFLIKRQYKKKSSRLLPYAFSFGLVASLVLNYFIG